MRWIVGEDLVTEESHLQARRIFIQRISGAETTDWKLIYTGGLFPIQFFSCRSNDKVNGVFITAHTGDVRLLCSFPEIYRRHIIVINSCIWEENSSTHLLHKMMRFNQNVELWFSKQEPWLDSDCNRRQTTTLDDVGLFGFSSSLSERKLFKHRKEGLVEAIKESFVRVSPSNYFQKQRSRFYEQYTGKT